LIEADRSGFGELLPPDQATVTLNPGKMGPHGPSGR
jgi:hypothetical protein